MIESISGAATIPLVGILTASLLTGCSSLTNPAGLLVDSTPLEKPELVLPKVDEYEGRPVIWVTVTPENIQEVWDHIKCRW